MAFVRSTEGNTLGTGATPTAVSYLQLAPSVSSVAGRTLLLGVVTKCSTYNGPPDYVSDPVNGYWNPVANVALGGTVGNVSLWAMDNADALLTTQSVRISYEKTFPSPTSASNTGFQILEAILAEYSGIVGNPLDVSTQSAVPSGNSTSVTAPSSGVGATPAVGGETAIVFFGDSFGNGAIDPNQINLTGYSGGLTQKAKNTSGANHLDAFWYDGTLAATPAGFSTNITWTTYAANRGLIAASFRNTTPTTPIYATSSPRLISASSGGSTSVSVVNAQPGIMAIWVTNNGGSNAPVTFTSSPTLTFTTQASLTDTTTSGFLLTAPVSTAGKYTISVNEGINQSVSIINYAGVDQTNPIANNASSLIGKASGTSGNFWSYTGTASLSSGTMTTTAPSKAYDAVLALGVATYVDGTHTPPYPWSTSHSPYTVQATDQANMNWALFFGDWINTAGSPTSANPTPLSNTMGTGYSSKQGLMIVALSAPVAAPGTPGPVTVSAHTVAGLQDATIDVSWSNPSTGATATSYQITTTPTTGTTTVNAPTVTGNVGGLTHNVSYTFTVTPYAGTNAGTPATSGSITPHLQLAPTISEIVTTIDNIFARFAQYTRNPADTVSPTLDTLGNRLQKLVRSPVDSVRSTLDSVTSYYGYTRLASNLLTTVDNIGRSFTGGRTLNDTTILGSVLIDSNNLIRTIAAQITNTIDSNPVVKQTLIRSLAPEVSALSVVTDSSGRIVTRAIAEIAPTIPTLSSYRAMQRSNIESFIVYDFTGQAAPAHIVTENIFTYGSQTSNYAPLLGVDYPGLIQIGGMYFTGGVVQGFSDFATMIRVNFINVTENMYSLGYITLEVPISRALQKIVSDIVSTSDKTNVGLARTFFENSLSTVALAMSSLNVIRNQTEVLLSPISFASQLNIIRSPQVTLPVLDTMFRASIATSRLINDIIVLSDSVVGIKGFLRTITLVPDTLPLFIDLASAEVIAVMENIPVVSEVVNLVRSHPHAIAIHEWLPYWFDILTQGIIRNIIIIQRSSSQSNKLGVPVEAVLPESDSASIQIH